MILIIPAGDGRVWNAKSTPAKDLGLKGPECINDYETGAGSI